MLIDEFILTGLVVVDGGHRTRSTDYPRVQLLIDSGDQSDKSMRSIGGDVLTQRLCFLGRDALDRADA
jgi:hypothetical protein